MKGANVGCTNTVSLHGRQGSALGGVLQQLAQIEICHFDGPALSDQQVGALQITMNDGRSSFMEIQHTLGSIHCLQCTYINK